MSDAFQRRRRTLMRSLKGQEIDVLAVSNPVNVTYLTGFTGDSSWVLLNAHRAVLVSDGRYEVQIAEECSGVEVVIRKPDRTIVQAVADTLTRLGASTVGVEAGHLTLADAERLRDLAGTLTWKPTAGLVEAHRRVKDAGEIARIRQAISIAEKAGRMFHAMLGEADTEKSLVDAMEGFVRCAGGRCSAFPTLVGIGNRSALPHVPPTDRRVDESTFLLLDWGAKESLYHSDLTRMIVTAEGPGRPVESRLRKLYTTVLQAQAVALRRIRAGVRAADVDRAVRAYLEKQGVHEHFNHGLGHGIGLQIHEGPFMRPNSEDVLESGMVVTVEPGVYFPEWGGVRIEDDVLVTPDGCEILTSMPRDVDSVFGNHR